MILQSHLQTQSHSSTWVGRLELPSMEVRRMSSSLGSTVGTLPEVLADLTGPLGDSLRRGIPKISVIFQLEGSLRGIRDMSGVSKEAIAGVVAESRLT